MPRNDNDDAKLTWFLMGAALGAAAALLLAPKSGRETRDLIAHKAQQASDAVNDTGRDLYERGKGVYERGREVLDKGKQVMDDAASLFDRARGLTRG